MRIIRNNAPVPEQFRNSSSAIGNFDGVHLGHQSVIDIAREKAVAAGRPHGVVTFEPHPRQFFGSQRQAFRLMNADIRARRISALEVGVLFELRFDTALSQLTAEEFSRDILAGKLGISHAVVGHDFRYGKGKTGNPDTLMEDGERFGFGVTVAPMIEASGFEISSTAARRALSEGKPEQAARILGHPHCVEGIVETGEQRGRTLGFPTANLSIGELHQPMPGIYAVRAEILTGPFKNRLIGAASLGTNPTFGSNPLRLEVYLFDFSSDIYGQRLSVELVEFIRPEIAFRTPDELISKMKHDCEAARAILENRCRSADLRACELDRKS